MNLIPSENVLSPAAKRALASDLAGRYAFKPEFYGGTRFSHEIWSIAEALGCEVFQSDFCSVSPLSGHIALMMTLDVCVGRGGKIASPPPHTDGYPGLAGDKIPDVMNIETITLPYDDEEHRVITEEALEQIRREKPKAVVLGASIILFSQPVKEISEETHSYGGVVIFDASHVLGLIAGKAYPNPLKEGADIMLGSTHKSFFGPQGGIILSNDEKIMKSFDTKMLHRFVDNLHFNRIAALAVALEEVKRYGMVYASRVVENAKVLARELEGRGVGVFKSRDGRYTETHQVYWPQPPEQGAKVRDRLEEGGIVVDMGVRFGTNEVTRLGMGVKQMTKVAELVKTALDGHVKEAKQEVKNLLKRFNKVKYTI